MVIGTGSGKSILFNDLQQQGPLRVSFSFVFESSTSLDDSDFSAVTILFDSAEAAQKIAYALRGNWDGCNGVELSDIDEQALETATSLLGGRWCYEGASEFIKTSLHSTTFHSAAHSLIFTNALPNFAEISFPISRAEVYWAIVDGSDPMSAQAVSDRIGLSKGTVQGHLSALERAGAIRGLGRPKQYTLAEDCLQDYLSQLQSCADIARRTKNLRGCA